MFGAARVGVSSASLRARDLRRCSHSAHPIWKQEYGKKAAMQQLRFSRCTLSSKRVKKDR